MVFAILVLFLGVLSSIFLHSDHTSYFTYHLFFTAILGFFSSIVLDWAIKEESISFLPKEDRRKKYKDVKMFFWFFISSGYILSKIFKDSICYRERNSDLVACKDINCKCEKVAKAAFISNANRLNLVVSGILLLFITIASFNIDLVKINFIWQSFSFFIFFRVTSRSVEIIYAFTMDVLNDESKSSSSLGKYDRIGLALKSYVENILNYSLVYYVFSNQNGIGGAILNSIGTATISKVHNSNCNLEQLFVYGQVLTSLCLVVLSLAIYISRKE
ncbi:hypothetical protein ACV1EC_05425 [Aeromonas hydrophila]